METDTADRPALVFCSGTLLRGTLQEKVEAATAGGFDAITLFPQDVSGARTRGESFASIRRMIGDAGLVVTDLDPLLTWLPGEVPDALVGNRNGDFYVAPLEEFLEIANEVGGTNINAAQGFRPTLDRALAGEALARVCDETSALGLTVTLEFLPWSGIPDLRAAADIVARSGRDEAKIMFDTWHWFRGSRDLDDLRAFSGDRIGSVQLNDATDPPSDDLPRESSEARRMIGDGAIPITSLLDALQAIGSKAPLGVEVFSEALWAETPTEVGRRCGDALRSAIARSAFAGPP